MPNTTISSTVANTLNSNLATGLSTTICRDGQSTVTANIPFAGFKLTGVGNGTATTDAINLGQLTSGLATLTGFLGGLALSAAGSTATFGIAVGIAANSTSALLLSLASAFTKTTSSWVVGTATGSLDTGSIANSTWYHVFIIGAPTVAADILISLSPTAPTLPATYTLFRRIGSMKTDGSAQWVKFSQNGNYFTWATPAARDVDYAPTATQALKVVNVPTGITVIGRLRGWFQGPTATVTSALVSSPSESGLTTVNTTDANLTVFVDAGTTGTLQGFSVDVLTNTSAQVNCVASSGSVLNVLRMSAYGWIDVRGQG